MSARKKPIVGLFVEGSRHTDPLRDDFGRMWKHLTEHCGHEHGIDLRVFGISKGQIIRLQTDLPTRKGATQLVSKGQTQLVGSGDPLDLVMQRAYEKTTFERVIVAFDRWRPNQLLPVKEQKLSCPMRPEVSFVLRHLVSSRYLDKIFRDAARTLLSRYQSQVELEPRMSDFEALEVVFMDPMFEALFVADEQTVRKALNVEKKKPKDWPKFKTHKQELDKAILDVAIWAVTGKKAAYTGAKSRWGYAFAKAAMPNAALWQHSIMTRLCRMISI